MKKRSNNRKEYSLKYWWYRLKQFWRSLVRSIRIFFTDAPEPRRTSPRSPKTSSRFADDDDFMLQPAIAVPRPVPFLLGLDDLPDLDLLTTRELVDQIEWNADSGELVMAKEEDLSLLEDLLINFPES